VRILSPRRAPTPLPIPTAEALAGRGSAAHRGPRRAAATSSTGVRERYQGLVVAGFGVGHVTRRLVPALEDLAARMPVVLTSRTGAGPVLRHTYGAAGGEIDLQRRGLINGGLLHPYKARVLLRLLLAGGVSGREQVAAAFAEHG
jgi:L-asparaginase